MADAEEPPLPPRPTPRQVLRLILPVFALSAVVMAVGVILVVTHHRRVGLVLVVVGAVGGFAVRTRLMIHAQLGRRPPR